MWIISFETNAIQSNIDQSITYVFVIVKDIYGFLTCIVFSNFSFTFATIYKITKFIQIHYYPPHEMISIKKNMSSFFKFFFYFCNHL